jgi:hypothetical protein
LAVLSLCLVVTQVPAQEQGTMASTTAHRTTLPNAATAAPQPLDHYRVYRAEGPDGPPKVTLDDEFQTQVVNLNPVGFFMSPARVNGEGILDPVTHYACYEIWTETFSLSLDVTNRFGSQTLHLGDPAALCVPTEKSPDPEPVSLSRDHYTCYEASGPPQGVLVDLADQFQEQSGVQVLAPVMFCVPADTNGGGIVNTEEQLTCYVTEPPGDAVGPLAVRNQFHDGNVNVAVLDTFAFCAPSRKRTCVVDEDCDDDNVCTDDLCAASTKSCIHQPNAASCETGDACTSTAQCVAGECVGEVAEVADIVCKLNELLDAPCGEDPFPARLRKFIARKVKRARRSLERAERAAEREREGKVERLRAQATKQLDAIPGKTTKAFNTRKQRQHISNECKTEIDGLVQEGGRLITDFVF